MTKERGRLTGSDFEQMLVSVVEMPWIQLQRMYESNVIMISAADIQIVRRMIQYHSQL
jgi:hypothetical protein